MNRWLFASADFLSRPPGFYWVSGAMIVCTVGAFFVNENAITFGLSVAAIVITGIVLIQGYRDTAAIHAKLDELIVAVNEASNRVVGLEHETPEAIEQALKTVEEKAQRARPASDPAKPA